MAINIQTGLGRIVWGNPAEAKIQKNFTTKQPVLKDGQQVQEWSCGVAFLNIFTTRLVDRVMYLTRIPKLFIFFVFNFFFLLFVSRQ